MLTEQYNVLNHIIGLGMMKRVTIETSMAQHIIAKIW